LADADQRDYEQSHRFTPETGRVSDIQASVKTVRDLLKQTYRLEAYQRDYVWTTKQVDELLRDLFAAFRPRIGDVGSKGYFLGALLVRHKAGEQALIDGQQRLTTLMLLIIALRRRLAMNPTAFSQPLSFMGRKRVPDGATPRLFDDVDRERVFKQLDNQGRLDVSPQSAIETALTGRYSDVMRFLDLRLEPEDTAEFELWLLDKVAIAEVRAGPSHDAFSLFDAMNSRGTPLQALDEFTNFIGRRIPDHAAQTTALNLWREALDTVGGLGAGAQIDFVKSWLAARCLSLSDDAPPRATDAKRRLADSAMSEIDQKAALFAIENADARPELGLINPIRFVEEQAVILSDVFARIRTARASFDRDLQGLYFLEALRFDLDLYDEVFLLACARPGDEAWLARVRVGVQFLENIAARWAWTTGVKSPKRHMDRVKYIVAAAASAVRDKPDAQLGPILQDLQSQLGFDFADNPDIQKSGKSPHLHPLLARITAYLDELNGQPFRYGLYEQRGAHGYEIEHLLPKTFSAAGDDTGHSWRREDLYRGQRERLGALVLAPGGLVKELSAATYAQKRNAYASANLNPWVNLLFGSETLQGPLRQVMQANNLRLPNVARLDRAALDARQSAIQAFAEMAWSPARLKLDAQAVAA
jgi:hypothetical protein